MLRRRFREMPAEGGAGDAPFLYGTHYSCPCFVMFWLVRAAPGHILRRARPPPFPLGADCPIARQFDRPPDQSFRLPGLAGPGCPRGTVSGAAPRVKCRLTGLFDRPHDQFFRLLVQFSERLAFHRSRPRTHTDVTGFQGLGLLPLFAGFSAPELP